MKEVSIIAVDLAKNVFPAAWGSSGRVGRLPQEAATNKFARFMAG